ncbi:MAG TPA: hypothetical protein VNM22_08210 [Candidatus Limnocylindrales bacterium]|nr:hypothetical protein [Candidatus Limnocylindrales bacterium]
MKTVVGIFTSHSDAKQAAERLRSVGISKDRINFLIPGSSGKEPQTIPITETEQPGIGKAIGSVVGGAVGAGAGLAIPAFFLPGVGPVIALGFITSALLGTGGAIGGAMVGGALEDYLAQGLPKDELFLYEDALRRGRTVLMALVEEETQVETVRDILTQIGAESLDSAREDWWIGLRHAEELSYTAQGGNFKRDEQSYRRGFEAALHVETRGKPYEEVLDYLQKHDPGLYQEEAFRRGYERGRAYYQDLRERYQSKD